MKRNSNKIRQWGVSLIEAVVAMGVMGVGTLAVLGVQSTLRFNADIAKQRNDAVRIASAELERSRAFVSLQGYEGIVNQPTATRVAGYDDSNAEYFLRRYLTEPAGGIHAPRHKTLMVEVSWNDRSGQTQSVRLSSAIHGQSPVLAASLNLPAVGARATQPLGRHSSIPLAAVNVGGGRSEFRPPGAGSTVVWTFNNATGAIDGITGPGGCRIDDRDGTFTCKNGVLVSGFIRYALIGNTDSEGRVISSQPTKLHAEKPPPAVLDSNFRTSFGVDVELSSTGSFSPQCFHEHVRKPGSETQYMYTRYWCAVPAGGTSSWTGRILLKPNSMQALWRGETNQGLPYKACLYPVTQSFSDLTGALGNYNFLLVNDKVPGSGTIITCPDRYPTEPATTPPITVPHVPST